MEAHLDFGRKKAFGYAETFQKHDKTRMDWDGPFVARTLDGSNRSRAHVKHLKKLDSRHGRETHGVFIQ